MLALTVVASGAAMQQAVAVNAMFPPAGPEITNPILTRTVTPEYPTSAVAAGLSGICELDVDVRETGHVANVRILRSLDTVSGLDERAVAAARDAIFEPAHDRNGAAVKASAVVVTEFAISRGRGTVSIYSPLRTDAPGVVAPKPIRSGGIRYPTDGRKGEVRIEAVVTVDGRVKPLRVLQSVPGIDGNVVDAIQTYWTFYRGTLNGRPVPTLITVKQVVPPRIAFERQPAD